MADLSAVETFRLADVFGKAFRIFGRRFVPFFVLALIAQIPAYLALLAVGLLSETAIADGDARSKSAALVVTIVATVFLYILGWSLANGAVIFGVVQELRGRTFSVANSLKIGWHRLLPILGVGICTTFLIMLGTLLFLIPGLMITCAYYVAMPACVAERTGVFDSMSRSAFLTKGYRWQVFGILLLLGVADGVVQTIAAPVLAAIGSVGQTIGSITTQVIVTALNGVVVGVLYYQLRVAKEGIDIDDIASVFD